MLSLPLLLCLTAAQPPDTTIPLWDGKAPHAVGDSAADKPSMLVARAGDDKATGAAVVICPGGGYGFLADDHEGKQVAGYFNSIGVTAFVLKYRIVAKDRPGPLHPAPLEDAQRAIRTVRFRAKEFGIDPKRVGIMGFSAGGHLASTAATHFHTGPVAPGSDAIDAMSDRPDFAGHGHGDLGHQRLDDPDERRIGDDGHILHKSRRPAGHDDALGGHLAQISNLRRRP